MAAGLEGVGKTWRALEPIVDQAKCAGCECLRAALVELKLALAELPSDGRRSTLEEKVDAALRRGEPHACLGCKPCQSGNILADFYRDQQAHDAAPSACGDGSLA